MSFPQDDSHPEGFAIGDWVAQFGCDPDRPRIAKIKNEYADLLCRDERVVDLILYEHTGERLGRISPACGGPRGFEPACPASLWTPIEEPDFDFLSGARYHWGDRLKRRTLTALPSTAISRDDGVTKKETDATSSLFFSHDEALQRLAANPAHCAFAFWPKHFVGDIAGGVFFFLEPGEPKPLLRVVQGRFFTGEAKTGVYNDEEAELHTSLFLQVFGVDPRTLRFKPCTREQIEAAIHRTIEHNASTLNGFGKPPQSERDITPEWEAMLLQHLSAKDEASTTPP